MSALDCIPGLTLNLKSAIRDGRRGTLSFTVALPEDESVWDEVVNRLDGHRILAGPGLAAEALELAEQQHQKEISNLRSIVEKQRVDIERLNVSLAAQARATIGIPKPLTGFTVPSPPKVG